MIAMRAARRVQSAKTRAKRAPKKERDIKRIDITGLPQGAMLKVKTEFSTYWVVVVDPTQKKVAVSNNSKTVRNGPDMFFFEGATIRPGVLPALDTKCIMVDARMSFAFEKPKPGKGSFLDTSIVEKIWPIADAARAKVIVDKAMASTQ